MWGKYGFFLKTNFVKKQSWGIHSFSTIILFLHYLVDTNHLRLHKRKPCHTHTQTHTMSRQYCRIQWTDYTAHLQLRIILRLVGWLVGGMIFYVKSSGRGGIKHGESRQQLMLITSYRVVGKYCPIVSFTNMIYEFQI